MKIIAQKIYPALVLASILSVASAQTNSDPLGHSAAIPFDQIDSVAGRQYSGDGLSVLATQEGARLRCAFQQLNARITSEGLWLASTKDGSTGKPFRVIASALGRTSPENRRAPNDAPYLTLAVSGKVQVDGDVARFIRPELTEEYSVGIGGLRQDFLIEQRPPGKGQVRLELEVDGAKAEVMSGGAWLVLDDGGRQIVYNRLKAEDANGKQLTVVLEVESGGQMSLALDDTDVQYPVRIDPTFSDANWISFGGFPGVNGQVYATVVDGMGNVYVGGHFDIAGNILASDVAKWNGSSWSALGSGSFSAVNVAAVHAMVILGTNLFVGGSFTMAGGIAATNIAEWNGTSWSAVGAGLVWEGNPNVATVSALAVSSNTLFVGGEFTSAGGVAATNIVEWNGHTWLALGLGVNGSVSTLAVSANKLFVGGYFTSAGEVTANQIAQWDGSSWSALGSGMGGFAGQYVSALAVSGTNLFAGGSFTTPDGINYIAEWNGSGWSGL